VTTQNNTKLQYKGNHVTGVKELMVL